ncbi:MAG: hypothetical protein R6V74_00530 [Lutibacter sp.]
MARRKLDSEPKRNERLTAFIDEDAMKRIKWAAFVTNKSVGEVLSNLIKDNINEPPAEIDQDPFKK